MEAHSWFFSSPHCSFSSSLHSAGFVGQYATRNSLMVSAQFCIVGMRSASLCLKVKRLNRLNMEKQVQSDLNVLGSVEQHKGAALRALPPEACRQDGSAHASPAASNRLRLRQTWPHTLLTSSCRIWSSDPHTPLSSASFRHGSSVGCCHSDLSWPTVQKHVPASF